MDRIVSPQIDNYIRHFVKSTLRSIKDANQFGCLYKKHASGLSSHMVLSYMDGNLYKGVLPRIPKDAVDGIFDCFKTFIREAFVDAGSKKWRQKLEALRNSSPDRWAYDFEVEAQGVKDYLAESAWHRCDMLWHTAMLNGVVKAMREISDRHKRK